jgi:hypothetical protein
MADASSALRKLQTGQPLTDAEKKLLGISVTTPAPATPAASTTPAPKPVTALEGLKNDSAATAASKAPVAVTPTAATAATTATAPDPTKTAYADLTPAQRAAMTNAEKMDYLQSARTASMAADATARAASSPETDFSNRPDAPPADSNYIYYYSWIGGVNSGQWRLYRAVNTEENQAAYGSRAIGGPTQGTATTAVGANALKTQPNPIYGPDGTITGWDVKGSGNTLGGTGGSGGGGGGGGGGGTGGGGTGGSGAGGAGGSGGAGGTGAGGNITGAPTTNIDVLKAALRGMGFSSTIVEASTSFLNGLIRDGLDYDNATEIFLNSKEYTLKNGQKITSPFYTEYGYLNEGLTVPKTANELFNTVEGFKGVADKYKLSSKYLTQDALKSYVKNDVTVADLAERAGTAQLRALEADPFQVNALIKQGFISSAADLADFYLDPKIGKEQLELNRQTGVFTAEALRRSKSGISTSAAQLSGFKQLTATLAAKGYSEAQIAQLAGQGFENISETLQPTTQLAQIYEKAGGTVESNAALTENIQNSLLQEEFMGTASERRKRLSEQNVRAFQGSAGTTTGSLRQTNVLGIL